MYLETNKSLGRRGDGVMEVAVEDLVKKIIWLEQQQEVLKRQIESINSSPMMSQNSAVKYLKIGKDRFKTYVNSGEINPVIFPDGKTYYDKRELDAFIKKYIL